MSVNAITPTGLTIQNYSDIVSEILNGTASFAGMYSIYGPNINVNPNSPDGQMINIVALSKEDMLQLIQQVNASFDPDQAVGTVLDQRCAINGVLRQVGTYTVTNVSVSATQAATLQGLDLYPAAPFTVSDSSGNQFQLVTTYAFVGPGTQVLAFQAALIGAVQTVTNTITTIVTPQLGITSVNNPTSATVTGVTGQSDASLKIDRRKGISMASRGFLESIVDNVAQVSGVSYVTVIENNTGSTVAPVPAYSIWVIVVGGVQLDVATAINNTRSFGAGMYGATSQVVTNPNGSTITIKFDYATSENLFIAFSYTVVTGSDPGHTYIANQIAALLTYIPGQTAVASDITALVQAIAPGISITGMSIGPTSGVGFTTKAPTDKNYVWTVSAGNIAIT